MNPRLPQLTAHKLVKVLEKAGFNIVRQTGGHTIMYKEGWPRPIPVPKHSKELKRSLLITILKEARISPDELTKYL